MIPAEKTARKREQTHRLRKNAHHRRQHDDDQQQRLCDDRQVLTFAEWCELNGISQRTGRRIIAGEYGPPPTVVQLSPKRIGITYGNSVKWQQSRERVA